MNCPTVHQCHPPAPAPARMAAPARARTFLRMVSPMKGDGLEGLGLEGLSIRWVSGVIRSGPEDLEVGPPFRLCEQSAGPGLNVVRQSSFADGIMTAVRSALLLTVATDVKFKARYSSSLSAASFSF